MPVAALSPPPLASISQSGSVSTPHSSILPSVIMMRSRYPYRNASASSRALHDPASRAKTRSSQFLSPYTRAQSCFLLDRDGFGQVAREVDVKTLHHGQPVGNELQGNNVQNTLQDVDGLGDLNRLGLRGLELGVARVADDNGLATTRHNYAANCQYTRENRREGMGQIGADATYLAGKRSSSL